MLLSRMKVYFFFFRVSVSRCCLFSLQITLCSFKSECRRARVCSPLTMSVDGQERARSGLSYKLQPVLAWRGRLTVSSRSLFCCNLKNSSCPVVTMGSSRTASHLSSQRLVLPAMRHCHLLSKGGRKKFQLLVLLKFTDLTVSLSEPLEPEFFMGLTVKKCGSTSDKISEVFLRVFVLLNT